MILAQTNNTPISFWLDLPIRELSDWIADSNKIVEKRNKEIIENHRKR